MFRAHPGVLEGPQAVANTAVKVLLCEPWAPKGGLIDVGIVSIGIVILVIVLAVLFFLLAGFGLRDLVEASASNE
jgi:hypothetical protein